VTVYGMFAPWLWLLLIYFESKVPLVGCWWLVFSEREVLLTVADKPNEQDVNLPLPDGDASAFNFGTGRLASPGTKQ
jgi:hypothetical protein